MYLTYGAGKVFSVLFMEPSLQEILYQLNLYYKLKPFMRTREPKY